MNGKNSVLLSWLAALTLPTIPNQYSSLLLKQGAAPEDDEFVEVHIFGPMTVLTMAEVTVTVPKARPRATIVRAIKSKLTKHGVSVK